MRRLAEALGAAAVALLALCGAPSLTAAAGEPGPELTEPEAALAGALTCIGPPVQGAARDPVILFPAFSTDRESYGSNYLADLPARGIPTCSVTLDDFGFADLQRAAEYAVHAVRSVSERSGRQVAVVGHQHGAINWLQALRYWPDIAGRVSDYVSLATPHRGTDAARSYCDRVTACPPAVWQIATGSQLLTALTEVQAPAGPSYTSIATAFDEVITPAPEASNMAGARNIVLQDICPGRPVDHFTILTDDLARRLTFDALDHPGPTDPARVADPCTGSAGPGGSGLDALGFPGRFVTSFATEAVPAEPPLRCYVAGTCRAPAATPPRLDRAPRSRPDRPSDDGGEGEPGRDRSVRGTPDDQTDGAAAGGGAPADSGALVGTGRGDGGDLPFTGSALALVVLAGGLLAVAGWVLRRRLAPG